MFLIYEMYVRVSNETREEVKEIYFRIVSVNKWSLSRFIKVQSMQK